MYSHKLASSAANKRDPRNSESGHVLITVAIAMTVLLGFAGIAADVSYLEHVKRRMQTAADAGALAGAYQLLASGVTNPCTDATANTNATTAARNDSQLNQYTNGSSNTTVTVNCPPTSGTYNGDNSAVEVIVSQSNQPNFFMAALGRSQATVAARAVGHLSGGNGCIVGLSRTASPATVRFGGTAIVTVGCGVFSNGNMTCSPGATLNTAFVGAAGSSTCSGAQNLVPIKDPLANLPAPTFPHACGTTGNGTSGTPYVGSPGFLNITGGTVYLNPGVYCGGIRVGAGATVYFNPGDYILAGGGSGNNALNINGGTVSGSGVFFYLTGSQSTTSSFTGETSYGTLSVNGGTTVNLSAPSSGTYSGILFYSDRTITPTGGSSSVTVNGTSGSGFDGAFYFPHSDVTINGTAAAGTTSAGNIPIIANTVTFTGGAVFNGNIAALPGGHFYSVAVLGE
jgi:hypothetical protein